MTHFFPRQCFKALVLGFCSLFVSAAAEEPVSQPYHDAPAPEHISLGHIEGQGLGYFTGYTSVDLFLSQPFLNKTLVPFADLRWHHFNSGQNAANTGLGLRWLQEDYGIVWGVNAFYDYYRTSQRNYHQVTVGLEALGECWELHVNGYLPVGDKKTNIYKFEYEDLAPTLFLMKAKEQLALAGIDAEFDYHFYEGEDFSLYAGAGPYYYRGRSVATPNVFRPTHRQAIGGRLRAGVSFMDYVYIEGIATYDSLFKWGGQVSITLSLPFDLTFDCDNGCCNSSYCLSERLYQPVLRNEIIVIDKFHRFSDNPEILDPEFEP